MTASTIQFKCDQCSYEGSSEKGVKHHSRLKHRISQLDGHCEKEDPFDTSYKCGGCGKVLNKEDDLADHEHDEHPLMCHICFSFSKNMDSKVTHYKENHFKIDGAL